VHLERKREREKERKGEREKVESDYSGLARKRLRMRFTPDSSFYVWDNERKTGGKRTD
jgi:hypothetical protein